MARSDGPRSGSEFGVRQPTLPDGLSARSRSGQRGTLTAQRVLVVDDNLDAVESLTLFLRIRGHEVSTAHDGPAALQSAGAFRPQIVFLDIGLPGMDGYEVARRLRQEHPIGTLMLVALTGHGQEEDRRRSLEAGFDHHLVKPAEPEELHRLLASLPRTGS